jgi:hypothetical protein
VKRLSARVVQLRIIQSCFEGFSLVNRTADRATDRTLLDSEAIEGLATAALAWLARILSSLLLKTASVLPA